jgi:hypothetical protein
MPTLPDPPYEVIAGDTHPPIRTTLTDEAGVIPLLGATVTFLMKQERGTKQVSGECEVLDVTTGEVAYQWQAGDTDVPGVYRAQWRVEFGNGAVEHVPSNDYDEVVIRDNLA